MKLMALIWLVFLFVTTTAEADTWVDVDGHTYVKIENGDLTIYSTDSFYFFDQLFSNVRKGAQLRLCIGAYQGTGLGSDCLGVFKPLANFNNEGKNRSLKFDVSSYSFIFDQFESLLRSGDVLRISIDDGELLSGYRLSKDYKLNDKAIRILKLPD